VPGRTLWLAGLEWPDEDQGLEGHSDGDCVAHAIVDAVLGAAGLGDIGSHFGSAEPEWADAAGTDFLRETARRVRAAGWSIGNVSVQAIGNRPKISTKREQAESVLSDAIGAPVSLSATTTDGLGLTGRGEGIAAIATAILFQV
jgi:2-C-methyl-D-erythritol 2,4-cyclodiphosphate synthase